MTNDREQPTVLLWETTLRRRRGKVRGTVESWRRQVPESPYSFHGRLSKSEWKVLDFSGLVIVNFSLEWALHFRKSKGVRYGLNVETSLSRTGPGSEKEVEVERGGPAGRRVLVLGSSSTLFQSCETDGPQ